MQIIPLFLLLISCASLVHSQNANNEANSPKNLTDEQILENLKKSIEKQISTEGGHISINYGKKGTSQIKAQNLNIEISDPDKTEDIEKIIKNAYEAALVGQYEASISLYKKALKMNPDDKNAMYSLATLHHKQKQLEEATNLYRKVLSIDPSNKDALNNFLVIISETNPESALSELQELSSVNPEFTPVQAQIGMVYAQQGKYKDAEQYLRRAILLDPTSVTYQYNLAVLYDRMKRYKEAMILYKRVLDAGYLGNVLPQSNDSIKQRIKSIENIVYSNR